MVETSPYHKTMIRVRKLNQLLFCAWICTIIQFPFVTIWGIIIFLDIFTPIWYISYISAILCDDPAPVMGAILTDSGNRSFGSVVKYVCIGIARFLDGTQTRMTQCSEFGNWTELDSWCDGKHIFNSICISVIYYV